MYPCSVYSPVLPMYIMYIYSWYNCDFHFDSADMKHLILENSNSTFAEIILRSVENYALVVGLQINFNCSLFSIF